MSVGQAEFRAAIFDPARDVPDGLVDPEGRPAGKRFDVYRNNVVVSLCNALAEAFPVIQKLLGAHNFGILAGHFVRQHPPSSPLIAHYGSALPGFLEGFAPVQNLGYLPDIARLELALRRAYHAANSTPADATALQAMPPERLLVTRFTLAPSVQLVASDWPIAAIWRFNAEDGPKPEMRAETALLTRPEFDPVLTALTPAGGVFVEALRNGQSLGEALEAAAAIEPEFDLSPAFSALVSGGAITEISEDPLP
ncbi:DNA-binding domain-containing protein [Aliiruegeria lutimaris]|uniref:Putative DNA-binding domain-containing protein n=1 Tax=Aliiruegeria lutimaris TaxID=571298 RepID=A0A1G8J1I2_9RHOB|nr:DNA-binding domain-containing protein [Aliiruegeria lutimaris]SDI24913.1 Putative DNA-binding domain-containing protein [Aliiruegeria lutimaris]